jgi:predicted transcriptional regulator
MSDPVRNIMTRNPTHCSADTSLQEVAKMMVDHDCGLIPVVGTDGSSPIGTITDRDITCRTVAEGKNPLELSAKDCMSSDCVTISEDAKMDECIKLMEKHKIRRILVTDSFGHCCGIVAQADVARYIDKKKTGEVVQEISKP